MFGLLGKIAKGIASGIKAAARFTGDFLRGVANVATKAINYVASRGPVIIKAVKKVIDKTKEFVSHLKAGIEKIANSGILNFLPELKILLHGVAKGLGLIEKVLSHAIFEKLEVAFKYMLKVASHGRDMILSAAELADAIAHREVIKRAKMEAGNIGRTELNTAEYIYDMAIVRTKINEAVKSGNYNNFDQYLALKATQKMLSLSQANLKDKAHAHIDEDDIFLLRAAEEMLSSDAVSDETLYGVDEIVQKRQHRGIYPFVFEELIVGWQSRINQLKSENATLTENNNDLEIEIEDMESAALLDPLTPEQERTLHELQNNLLEKESERRSKASIINSLEVYIHASEGLLQYLENPSKFVEEKDYLVENVGYVANLIIQSSQQERPLNELNEDDRHLITNFSNIFAQASEQRLVEVSA